MKLEKQAYFIMVLVNLIWGFGYIMSEYALQNNWPVFSILLFRNGIGFIVCFFIAFKTKFWRHKTTLKIGAIAGLLYFLGYSFQLYGQQKTTVTNTSLITSLGIIMGPLFYWVMFKKKPEWYSFIACFLGLGGAIILSFPTDGSLNFNPGDILVFISSLIYALHLTYVGHEGDNTPLFALLAAQFFTMTCLAGIGIIITRSKIVGDPKGWIGVLYYALISGILGIGGQFYCQRILDSYKISLLLALEGLFATIFSIILMNEPLNLQVIIGGLIMIFAVGFMAFMDWRKYRNPKVEIK